MQHKIEQTSYKRTLRRKNTKSSTSYKRALRRKNTKSSTLYFLAAEGRKITYFTPRKTKERTSDTDVKVGVTGEDVSKRIKQLQTGNANIITHIKSITTPRPFVLEKEMHRIFQHHHKLGEWYRWSAAHTRAVDDALGTYTARYGTSEVDNVEEFAAILEEVFLASV